MVRGADTGTPKWTTLIRESAETIDTWVGTGGMAVVAGDRVAVVYRRQADWMIRIFDRAGRLASTVDIPTGGSMWSGLIRDSKPGSVYLSVTTFVDPGTVYRLDLDRGVLEPWRRSVLPYDTGDYVGP